MVEYHHTYLITNHNPIITHINTLILINTYITHLCHKHPHTTIHHLEPTKPRVLIRLRKMHTCHLIEVAMLDNVWNDHNNHNNNNHHHNNHHHNNHHHNNPEGKNPSRKWKYHLYACRKHKVDNLIHYKHGQPWFHLFLNTRRNHFRFIHLKDHQV